MRTLNVTRIYGPIWQGEGRQRGQYAGFVRTANCPLECTWCDTPFTWVYSERKAAKHSTVETPYDPKKEIRKVETATVFEEMAEYMPKGGLVIFSGGEPLMQTAQLHEVCQLFLQDTKRYWRLAFETAGILPARDLLELPASRVHWNVSPKLAHSGNSLERRLKPDVIHEFVAFDADFKFVVQKEADFEEIDAFVSQFAIAPENVWIMPEGQYGPRLLQIVREVEKPILDRRWNMSLRDHVLLFGTEEDK